MAITRRMIFLSLGSMLEKVDAKPFIMYLIGKAMAKDKTFKPASVMPAALKLADQFNQELLPKAAEEEKHADTAAESATDKTFRTSVLKLFNLEELDPAEFWAKWNDIVTVGKLSERIASLDKSCQEHSEDLFAFFSDTNHRHLDKIVKEASEQKVQMDVRPYKLLSSTKTFANRPFYTTCVEKKDIVGVIGEMIDGFEKIIDKTVIFGDPKNIADPMQRALAEEKLKRLQELCTQKGVKLVLKANVPIEEVLAQLHPAKVAGLQLSPS